VLRDLNFPERMVATAGRKQVCLRAGRPDR
jgi:hypothetical protein